MGLIVCAIRGGQGSLAVRRRAIVRAQETGCRILFLSVVDSSPLAEPGSPLEAATRKELGWMNRVLVAIARQHAQHARVEADAVVRTGYVREEIVALLRERQPDLLLLGAPRGTTTTVFGDDAVESFARTIEAETGVRVEIARPEDVITETHE